jgi:hypothetical protein
MLSENLDLLWDTTELQRLKFGMKGGKVIKTADVAEIVAGEFFKVQLRGRDHHILARIQTGCISVTIQVSV